MSKIIEELKERWDGGLHVKDKSTRYLAIYNTHTQEWLLGWSSDKKKELILVTPRSSNISEGASSRYIKISERIIEQNKFLLYFTLMDDSAYEVYLKLCEDLIEQVREEIDTLKAQKIVLERFNLWKKMLESKPFTIDQHKGALGELLLIKDLLEKDYPAAEILEAWTGPEYTEQDFVFPFQWYEVKTVSSGAMVVTISSAGQLDHPGQGYLVVYHLDNQSHEKPESISIKKIVHELKNEYLENDFTAQRLFEYKLHKYNYDILALEDKYWFTYSHRTSFTISEDFPKLTHAVKRPEMQSIKYNLILSALEPWRDQ